MSLKTVQVPDGMSESFGAAERFVREFFDTLERDPARGVIRIGGQRYILVNADSMSVGFHEYFAAMFPRLDPEVASHAAFAALYDVAFNTGRNDARIFHRTMGVSDPIDRLSSGPVLFSHAGWARVHIWSIGRPVADESYRLFYDHPNSFESDAWIERVARGEASPPTRPVCVMSSGYSSGWCTESFGIPLGAREVFCRAKGDPCCRFVMAHRDHVDEVVARFLDLNPDPSLPAEAWDDDG